MNSLNLNIWNRKFNLPISYDWFEDEEELLPAQKEAINLILNHNTIFDSVLSNVKTYVLKFIPSEHKIDNIFKYVIPQKIYVLRKEKPTFALFCDFKFDLEHGIAVLFENNKFLGVVSQDEVL